MLYKSVADTCYSILRCVCRACMLYVHFEIQDLNRWIVTGLCFRQHGHRPCLSLVLGYISDGETFSVTLHPQTLQTSRCLEDRSPQRCVTEGKELSSWESCFMLDHHRCR